MRNIKKYTGGKTVKSKCPHCGHTKAKLKKPKICSRCKEENKGWEMRQEKHKRIRLRAVL